MEAVQGNSFLAQRLAEMAFAAHADQYSAEGVEPSLWVAAAVPRFAPLAASLGGLDPEGFARVIARFAFREHHGDKANTGETAEQFAARGWGRYLRLASQLCRTIEGAARPQSESSPSPLALPSGAIPRSLR